MIHTVGMDLTVKDNMLRQCIIIRSQREAWEGTRLVEAFLTSKPVYKHTLSWLYLARSLEMSAVLKTEASLLWLARFTRPLLAAFFWEVREERRIYIHIVYLDL